MVQRECVRDKHVYQFGVLLKVIEVTHVLSDTVRQLGSSLYSSRRSHSIVSITTPDLSGIVESQFKNCDTCVPMVGPSYWPYQIRFSERNAGAEMNCFWSDALVSTHYDRERYKHRPGSGTPSVQD